MIDLGAGVVRMAQGKSDAARREVSIRPYIIPVRREHLDRFGEPGRAGLIFIGEQGGPLRRYDVTTGCGRRRSPRCRDCRRGFSSPTAGASASLRGAPGGVGGAGPGDL
jgi:hypothetical protein